MWAKELYGFADHVPETEEYGVASFVYRARRPFEPEKIMAVLNGQSHRVVLVHGYHGYKCYGHCVCSIVCASGSKRRCRDST